VRLRTVAKGKCGCAARSPTCSPSIASPAQEQPRVDRRTIGAFLSLTRVDPDAQPRSSSSDLTPTPSPKIDAGTPARRDQLRPARPAASPALAQHPDSSCSGRGLRQAGAPDLAGSAVSARASVAPPRRKTRRHGHGSRGRERPASRPFATDIDVRELEHYRKPDPRWCARQLGGGWRHPGMTPSALP
jgi:hypothetical protein